MSITLVRHTRPEIAEGICYGRTDLNVATTFDQEVDLVVERLPVFEVLVTSPLKRCRRLADEIALRFAMVPEVDDRIQEIDFGSWERQAWRRIPRVELDAWADDFLHARPHGGESVAMVRSRALLAIGDYAATSKKHLVVTHAGVIRVLLADGDLPEDFEHNVQFGDVVSYPKKLEERVQ